MAPGRDGHPSKGGMLHVSWVILRHIIIHDEIYQVLRHLCPVSHALIFGMPCTIALYMI